MKAGHNYAGNRWFGYDALRINTQVGRFPVSWQGRLRKALGAMRTWGDLDRWASKVEKLTASERGGLRPDASDDEICQQAEVTARDFGRRLRLLERILRVGERFAAWRERYGLRAVTMALAHYCQGLLAKRGLLEVWHWTKPSQRAGAVERMKCPRFWRRVYRVLRARTSEAVAIQIGLVGKNAGLYCSDDALRVSKGADARCARVLESVWGANDAGQAFKLAELAAKGTANQEIRRAELLTRIAGFEHIAKQCGHIAYMVTATCPSRFHRCTTRGDRTVPNPRYADLTPRDGQEYLSKQWERARTAGRAKKRGGLSKEWYGFRIAEPQHDGTPHWHLLLFMPPVLANGRRAAEVLRELFLTYFLENDSPEERGAAEYRVDFEEIDWAKGSAVGYVIKYVSKNIDGHGVGYDLYGEPAITSSQRVRAWARTWRVRQFQQIGGAPVTVWREMRRVHPENVPATAPEALREAISAMNVAKVEPGVQSVAWAKFNAAMGGVNARRACHRIKLVRKAVEQRTRYGERAPDRIVGVEAWGVELFRNHIHQMNPAAPEFERRVLLQVESERAQWLMGGASKAQALAVAAEVFQRSGEAASTRIHVNNCTAAPLLAPPRSPFLPVRRRMRKLRRFGWHETAPGRPPGTSMELQQ